MNDLEFQLLDPVDVVVPPRFASLEEWHEYQKKHHHSHFVQTERWQGNKVTYSKLKCADLDCGFEFGKERTEVKEPPFHVLKALGVSTKRQKGNKDVTE